ncbi:MAG: GNAT family N-acetyltransferase [Acidobacteriota bacterium]
MTPFPNALGPGADLSIAALTAAETGDFAAMTFGAYLRYLSLQEQERSPAEGDHRLVQPVVLGARVEGQPVGLAVAEWPVSPSSPAEIEQFGEAAARLISLFVSASARRRGIACALLEAVEEEIARRGGGTLEAVYTTGKPAIAWLEKVFARRRWTSPEGRSLLVRFTPAAPYASGHLREDRLARLRRGLEFAPFSSVDAGELEELRAAQKSDPWIPPLLAPWRYDLEGADPSSLAVRSGGQLVGWAITHRPTPGLLRFTCAYLRRDLAASGRLLAIQDAVLQRVRGTCEECSFTTSFAYPPMIRFIRRRFAPFSHVVAETRIVRRTVS